MTSHQPHAGKSDGKRISFGFDSMTMWPEKKTLPAVWAAPQKVQQWLRSCAAFIILANIQAIYSEYPLCFYK